MLIHIITLRFSSALEGFDDSPLVDFIKDKSVISLREHFFIRNEIPYLVTVVIYEPVMALETNEGWDKQRRGEEPWRDSLKDADMQLFNSLRSWRAERCKQEGIPPYVICNNKELAEIVLARPQTLSKLLQVNGFGKSKANKYGQEMLALLKSDNEQSEAKSTPE